MHLAQMVKLYEALKHDFLWFSFSLICLSFCQLKKRSFTTSGTQWSLKQHASRFMQVLKMYLNVKYSELNKEINLHSANGAYSPSKLPKMGQNMQK
jgi:hypothetical protein